MRAFHMTKSVDSTSFDLRHSVDAWSTKTAKADQTGQGSRAGGLALAVEGRPLPPPGWGYDWQGRAGR